MTKTKINRANLALVSLIIIAVYVGLIVLDIRIPIINPPDRQNEIPILRGERLSTIGQPDCYTVVYLRYDGILVTGKQVMLSAVVYLETPFARNLTTAHISFPQSLAYPPENNSMGIPNNSGLDIYNDGTGRLVGKTISIYFPTLGDYDYDISFLDSNGSVYSLAPISGEFAVHVEPSSELSTERFNQATMGISLALIYFAFLQGFYLYLDHRKEENKQEKITQEIERLNQKLDKVIKKNTQSQDTNSNKANKESHH